MGDFKKPIALLLVFVLAGIATAKTYRSCREIKQDRAYSPSGLYRIATNIGRLWVYCEMQIDGGGFTFIPEHTCGKRLDLRSVFMDKTTVLLQLRYKDKSQKYTVIEPLKWYQPLSVQINGHYGYQSQKNKHMGPYFYFGVTSINNGRRRNTQGFKSNGRPVTFRNCDGNPNGYFALFPNIYDRKPSSYHSSNLVYERQGLAVDWRNTALVARANLPASFFYFTEIHFGGCGTYTSSDRWRDGATGVAIGIR